LPDAAAALPDGFFNLWGKAPRESSCECERQSNVALRPVLNLINGATVNDAIKDPGNRLARLEASIPDDAKLVEEVFLSFYARRPTPKEVEASVQAVRTAYQEELATKQAELAEYEKQRLGPGFAAWLASGGKGVSWTVLEAAELKSASGATLTKQPDGSILLGGANPATDTYTATAKTNLQGITGFRLEVLPHDSLAAKGPGRAANGNFVLNKFDVKAAEKGAKEAAAVSFVTATGTFAQDGFTVYQTVAGGNPQRGWAVAPRFGQAHEAVYEVRGSVGAGETTLTFTLPQNFGGQHTIGRFRISATTSPQPRAGAMQLPGNIAALLALPAEKRTAAQMGELKNYYLAQDAEYQRLKNTVNEYVALAPHARLVGVQDLAWAMINSPAFLFNR
jgi:hypothetical protein